MRIQKYKANYHTHCHLCKHAIGTVEDYVIKAIENGFQAIGISDHAPLDFLEERSVRMAVKDYPKYIQELKHAIVHYLEYILIYRSLEIEYFDFLHKHYDDLLSHLDYLILGQHYIQDGDELKSIYKIKTLNELNIYKNTVIKAMNTGYFKILAHPDIFLINQGKLNQDILNMCEEIIDAAMKNNVLLELNANGLRKKKHKEDGKWYPKYPRNEFWEIVNKKKAKTIISADAHDPKHLVDEAMDKAYELARHLSLEVEEELVLD
ncbi:histidinol-phosphatase [Mycoplasmatota bacterium]|nr:histidinol-phosphatase [Mycoplasmatota bacterium]